MICGGSISGNSASGRPDIAISPVITVRIAITIATIGRLIKKFEIIYSLTSSLRSLCVLCVSAVYGLFFTAEAQRTQRLREIRSVAFDERFRRDGHAWSDFQG